jgi:uncharacterized membrane protein YhaH (DUF805 family)
MDWVRVLFSFRGSIGRVRFWLILFLGQLPVLLPLPEPFVVKVLSFPLAGVLGGEAQVGYLRAEGPVTVAGWLFLASYGVAVLGAFWIFAATMTKRLHDRGRSGKWLLPLVIGLSAVIGFSYLLSRTDARFMPLDIANLIFFAVVTIFGCWLMLEMAFLPGDTFYASNNPSETDFRRAR